MKDLSLSVQPDLFGAMQRYSDMPPHQRHSETSRAAAEKVKDRRGPSHRKIIAFLERRGRATDEQMQNLIPMIANTQRPRRVELVTWGFVRDSGFIATTLSGEAAVLWELVR